MAMPEYKKRRGHTCKFDFPLTNVDCGNVVFDAVEEHFCGWENKEGQDDMTLYDCDVESVRPSFTSYFNEIDHSLIRMLDGLVKFVDIALKKITKLVQLR